MAEKRKKDTEIVTEAVADKIIVDKPAALVAETDPVAELASKISANQATDILVYNGDVVRSGDQKIRTLMEERQRKPNLLMILVTPGGDPHAAYRIARECLRCYDHFSLFVSGYCKSAGTLVAMGAHELVFCNHGELGPIDIQISKKDEPDQFESTWNILQAIDSLVGKTYSAFQLFFYQTKRGSNNQISVPTAAHIATELTTGLMSPISAQIDPMRIGEVARAMNISSRYGNILMNIGGNLTKKGLDDFLSGYPDHGFVIDREAAEKMFRKVRTPNPDELALAKLLGDESRFPSAKNWLAPEIRFL